MSTSLQVASIGNGSSPSASITDLLLPSLTPTEVADSSPLDYRTVAQAILARGSSRDAAQTTAPAAMSLQPMRLKSTLTLPSVDRNQKPQGDSRLFLSSFLAGQPFLAVATVPELTVDDPTVNMVRKQSQDKEAISALPLRPMMPGSEVYGSLLSEIPNAGASTVRYQETTRPYQAALNSGPSTTLNYQEPRNAKGLIIDRGVANPLPVFSDAGVIDVKRDLQFAASHSVQTGADATNADSLPHPLFSEENRGQASSKNTVFNDTSDLLSPPPVSKPDDSVPGQWLAASNFGNAVNLKNTSGHMPPVWAIVPPETEQKQTPYQALGPHQPSRQLDITEVALNVEKTKAAIAGSLPDNSDDSKSLEQGAHQVSKLNQPSRQPDITEVALNLERTRAAIARSLPDISGDSKSLEQGAHQVSKLNQPARQPAVTEVARYVEKTRAEIAVSRPALSDDSKSLEQGAQQVSKQNQPARHPDVTAVASNAGKTRSAVAVSLPDSSDGSKSLEQGAHQVSKLNQPARPPDVTAVASNVETTKAAMAVSLLDLSGEPQPLATPQTLTDDLKGAASLKQASISNPVLPHTTSAVKPAMPVMPSTKVSKGGPPQTNIVNGLDSGPADKPVNSTKPHLVSPANEKSDRRESTNGHQESVPSTSQSHSHEAAQPAVLSVEAPDASATRIQPTSPVPTDSGVKSVSTKLGPSGSQLQPTNLVDTDPVDTDPNDETAPSPGPQMTTAQLVRGVSQSEFRVGIHSTEFGNVDIRTSMARHEFTAQISVEHAGVARALTAGLHGLYDRLSDERIPVTTIVVQDQSTSTSSGQEQRTPHEKPFASRGEASGTTPTKGVLPVAPDRLVSAGRLDIRI